MSFDLTPEELAALAEGFGDDPNYQEREWEYAIVSYRRGKPYVHGPYPHDLAIRKAKDGGGVVAQRVRSTSWGRWTLLGGPEKEGTDA